MGEGDNEMDIRSWGRRIRQFLDSDFLRSNRRIRIGTYILLGIIMYVILIGSILPPRYDFSVGDTAPMTIRAPVTAVDTQATKRAKDEAMAKVPKQYAMSTTVETNALSTLDGLFNLANNLASQPSMTTAHKVIQLQAVAPKEVSAASLNTLAQLNKQQLADVQSVSETITKDLLSVPFNEQSEAQANSLVDNQLIDYDLNKPSRLLVQNLVVSVLQPNMVYQKQKTEEARQAVADSVPSVLIQQGQVIVEKNGIITQQVLNQLKDVGLYRLRPIMALPPDLLFISLFRLYFWLRTSSAVHRGGALTISC